MRGYKQAYIFAALSVLCWSTVASAFKLALKEFDFVQTLFYASLTSTLVLLAALGLQGKLRDLFRQSLGDISRSALMGFINPTLYYLVLFKAYSLLPAQEAQPLNWTWPITLSVMSALFLKQRLSKRKIVAILVSFAGVLVISTRGNLTAMRFTNLTGDVLAVSSSFLWGMYWIMNLKDERNSVLKLATNFIFGSFYNTIALFTLSSFTYKPFTGVCYSIYIGVFEMGITFLLWLKALNSASSSAAVANFAYITPFLSLIFIHTILGETILWSSFVGLVLIISGIVFGVEKAKE